MDKKYQVFISSTFRDLINERQAVLRAVLELGHMPAGMELFPAADESAWELIRDVIDASDYYVLIIGGRYGSLDDTGLGYTEKEYDYAVQRKIPVIPLLHQNPDNLPREKTDTEAGAWRKLQQFRSQVEKKHTCVYWQSAEELKAHVIVGITTAAKRYAAIGWVRADQVPAETIFKELLGLRNRIAELETQAEADRSVPPKGTEDLRQGDDTFKISGSFVARPAGLGYGGSRYEAKLDLPWNDIFGGIAPTLINEASHRGLRLAFKDHFQRRFRAGLRGSKNTSGKELVEFEFQEDEIETCIVQFRALGLIRESARQRSVKDTETYWCLTPHGDLMMTRLRAIRKAPPEEARQVGHLTSQEAKK